MTRLVLVCGMPGAGKTTHAQRIAPALGAVRMCPDDWFAALGLDPHDGRLRDRFEAVQWAQALELLSLGQSVVVEFGSWMRAERELRRDEARRLGVEVELHVLDVPIEERWRRLAVRNASGQGVQISRDQLEEWEQSWQPPTAEELATYDSSTVGDGTRR